MVLKALEMQGFKSFPDRTVLRFDNGMTAVVGPNGSGKSNISDAVRWVLGEQSTKNLRGAKMEDVIFSGTAERKALGYAEVTLRLDNSDRSLQYDNDEVAITRRYYRSGESEYKINGQPSRLKDINELFMDTGLGRDGYSIVSQGKVADMVSARSSQRRDILEEAAGISHFRYRRGDALRRLAQAEENLVRLRDILSELESRVGPLKTQSEKAQQFLILADEKKQLEVSLWLYNIDHLKAKLKEQDHKIDVATAQYNGAEAALSKIEQDIDAAKERARNITLEIERIRGEGSARDEEASNLTARIAVAENTIALNKQSIERLEGDKETAALEQTEVEKTIAALRAEIVSLEQQAEDKKAELQTVAESMAALEKATGSYSKQAEDLGRQLAEQAERLAECKVKKTAAEASIQEIEDRASGAEDTRAERAALLSTLKTQKEEAEQRLKTAEDAVTTLNNAIDGYELRAAARTEKAEKRRLEKEALERDVLQKKDRLRLLEDMEKNMEGYTGSVKAVTQQAKRGTLRGIHGPLSQLITVDKDYALAVETALGAAIQNIVVDTEADAKRAIAYLKESHGGRATFLPISSIKSRDLKESGLDDCYGYVDLASNLVKADSKYNEILKAQLARTVVVEDMDSAISMAKKYNNRFRIVTLDGQVINAGGSMTGGSRVKNAGMLSRSGEMDKLRAEVAALQKKLEDALSTYEQAAAEASQAVAEKEATAADLVTANEEKVHAESALLLVKGQYESVSAALQELEDEALGNEARLKELQKEIGAAEAEEKDCLAQSEALNRELEKITGNMGDIHEKQEEITRTSAEINLSILSLSKDVEGKEGTIQHLSESTLSAEEKVAALQEQIDGFLQANEEATKDIEDTRGAIDRLKQAGDADQQKIDALTVERNAAEAEDTKLRALEKQKNDEHEKVSQELARLEERKVNMLRDYDNTVNKLFDEYEMTRREAAEFADPTEDPVATNRSLSEVKGKIKALGSVNVGAIEEYKEVSERYEFMNAQVTDVETSKKELTDLIDELTGNMAQQFRLQFNLINDAFGQTFKELFGGGKAELLLEDELDILECPIQIRVQPPGKNVQNIDLLSGGEKGLSAIALLCAILKVNPAPFCIFDEVEAALDDVNVSRFAQYVRRMTNNTQFILITHRRGTMEEADVMYGITMEEEGVSKLLELKTAEMVKRLGLKE